MSYFTFIFTIILSSFLYQIKGQQCNEDYVIAKNGQSLFTISATNGSCICKSFTGDGSYLSGLQNNDVITNLLTQINLLQNQVSLLNDTVAMKSVDNSGRTYTQGTLTPVIFNTPIFDTHNKYNSLTGYYTIPIKGKYVIEGKVTLNVGSNTNYYIYSTTTLNGTVTSTCLYSAYSGSWAAAVSPYCSDIIDCQIGDQIGYSFFYVLNPNVDVVIQNLPNYNSLYIYKL